MTSDINILLNYNFNPEDITDGDFDSLFRKRRLDSCFAFAYKKNGKVYALRDHMGAVPLYYRYQEGKVIFSTTLVPLIDGDCHLDREGFRFYVAFGSPRFKPLFKEIGVVPPGSVVEINPEEKKMKRLYTYQIEIPSTNYSQEEYVNKLDELLTRAVERVCHYDEVGLCLSGGIDSALTGIYLKKAGVEVNAYTSAPWGKKSSDIPFAKINAKKIKVKNHHINFLKPRDYHKAINYMNKFYGSIFGQMSGIGMANLWHKTPIREEKQLFGAQGADTLFCAVSPQNVVFFTSFLPQLLREKLHPRLKFEDNFRTYFYFNTAGVIDEFRELRANIPDKIALHNLLVLANFYTFTAANGEMTFGPALKDGRIFSNPFYDIEVIRFILSIPVRFKLSFSKKKPTKIHFKKKILQQLAARYLPKESVFRKNPYVVSLARNKKTRSIISDIPSKIFGVPLETKNNKFRTYFLLNWCKRNGVQVEI